MSPADADAIAPNGRGNSSPVSMRPRPLLLMGASVRSLAWSARRAGFDPVGLDLFEDQDLSSVGRTQRIHPVDYPTGFEAMASAFPREIPCVYTGALENHPSLVDSLSRQRPLWGISGEPLRAARDPVRMASVLQDAGLPACSVRMDPDGLPRDGTWLRKPIASAGGRKISAWRAGSPRMDEPCYFQKRILGTNASAVYLGQRDRVELLGVTVQILGRGGTAFGYRGSCGPIELSPRLAGRFKTLGAVLQSGLKLVGLFGVDVVIRNGEPWVVEINPRYSASVEVLELATGRSVLAQHAESFDPGRPVTQGDEFGTERPASVGKLIVDAPCDLWFDPGLRVRSRDLWAVPTVADLPRPGTAFRQGEPVLTVFASGHDVPDCLARLHRRWQEWRWRLRAMRQG